MEPAIRTPMSELIASHHANRTDQSYARFIDAFQVSKLGVVAIGIPNGVTGEFLSTARHPFSLAMASELIMAYADPVAFARRFGKQFNAEMSGEAILDTVFQNPECQGVMVNSALTELCLIIGRGTAVSLMYNRKPATKRRWWRFWSVK